MDAAFPGDQRRLVGEQGETLSRHQIEGECRLPAAHRHHAEDGAAVAHQAHRVDPVQTLELEMLGEAAHQHQVGLLPESIAVETVDLGAVSREVLDHEELAVGVEEAQPACGEDAGLLRADPGAGTSGDALHRRRGHGDEQAEVGFGAPAGGLDTEPGEIPADLLGAIRVVR